MVNENNKVLLALADLQKIVLPYLHSEKIQLLAHLLPVRERERESRQQRLRGSLVRKLLIFRMIKGEEEARLEKG